MQQEGEINKTKYSLKETIWFRLPLTLWLTLGVIYSILFAIVAYFIYFYVSYSVIFVNSTIIAESFLIPLLPAVMLNTDTIALYKKAKGKFRRTKEDFIGFLFSTEIFLSMSLLFFLFSYLFLNFQQSFFAFGTTFLITGFILFLQHLSSISYRIFIINIENEKSRKS